MRSTRLTLALTSALLVTLTPVAQATPEAEALAKFNELYGQAARGVKSTRTTSDDAKLAWHLLDAANNAAGGDAMTILLYEQTYEFGKTHTTGFKAAADALQALARIVPRRQLEMQEKLLFLYELIFRSATGSGKDQVRDRAGAATVELMLEVVDGKIKQTEFTQAALIARRATGIARAIKYNGLDTVMAREQELRPLAVLDRKLKSAMRDLLKDANDKEAAKAVTDIYLMDLDRPITARPYASVIWPQGTIELMTLAGKPVDSLTAQQCHDLATWYASLGEGASRRAQETVLVRAKMYYEAYLEKKSDDAAARTALTKVDLSLAKIGVNKQEADERVASRSGRLGVTVIARADPQPKAPAPQPKPDPQPRPDAKPQPKPDPQPRPDPDPDPAPPQRDPDYFKNYLEDEVESEYAQEKLGDEYWQKRKSIFDFGN